MKKTLLSFLTLSLTSLMGFTAINKNGFDNVNLHNKTPYLLNGGQENISDTKYGTFYQLLVYSFADGDGDGIGDFKGIIDHLDYLENLGIGGLYLSPIQVADSYHAYDITDYYHVNSEYEVTVQGVKYDLAKLLTECHNHGIKVLLDMVLNHCSYNHPWISTHPSWFTNDPAFDGMKDFNMNNESLKTELKNIGKYWLQNYDVDGYRLDAVKWFYNTNGMSYADDAKNIAFLREFYNACKTVKSDVYMIGENYTYDEDEVASYHAGIDSLFNFHIRQTVDYEMSSGRASDFVNDIYWYQKNVRRYNSSGIEASFLSNHDAGRFGSNMSNNRYVFAHLLNILAPGNSYVYYGDELNLQATVNFDNSKHSSGYEDFYHRTPMPFASERTNMKTYVNGFSDGYRPLISSSSSTRSGNSADADASSNSSIYSYFAKAIKAKNNNPVLYNGTISSNNLDGYDHIGSYIATLNSDSKTVIFNNSGSSQQLLFNNAITVNASISTSGEATVSVSGKVLTIKPYSATIIDGAHSFVAYSGSEDYPEDEPEDIPLDNVYLRGDFNAWITDSDYLLEPTLGGEFAYWISNVEIKAGEQFKVANVDWSVNIDYNKKNSTSGDFDECFKEGTENSNIQCRSGKGGHFDIYVTSTGKIGIWKTQIGYLKGSVIGWDTMNIVTSTITPWKEYKIENLYLSAGEEIKLFIDEVDTDWSIWWDADIVETNDETLFPVDNDNKDVNAMVVNSGLYDVTIYHNWDTNKHTYTFTGISNNDDAVTFAQGFNLAISEACDIDGNSDQTTVTNAWKAQSDLFEALPTSAKNILKLATNKKGNSDVATFAEKYDSVFTLRGEEWKLSNFANRTFASVSINNHYIERNDNTLFIVVVISLMSVCFTSALVLLKRRKLNK